MTFEALVAVVGELPLFATGLLLAGDVDPNNVRRQLSRWVAAGKVYQLRRGLYTLAPPFRKITPHPFLVANHLSRGSYVSRQSALAHFGLIPEYVAVTTSVTTTRPANRVTPLGAFDFRHIRGNLFYGYRALDVAPGQSAYVATPEKALLDLIYLTAGADATEYLSGLRLLNLGRLDLALLRKLAQRAGSPKLARAAERIELLERVEAEEFESL